MFSFERYQQRLWLQATLDVCYVGATTALCLWMAHTPQTWGAENVLWVLLSLPCYGAVRLVTLFVWLFKAISLRRWRLVTGILTHAFLVVGSVWVGLSLLVLLTGMSGVAPDGVEMPH